MNLISLCWKIKIQTKEIVYVTQIGVAWGYANPIKNKIEEFQ